MSVRSRQFNGYAAGPVISRANEKASFTGWLIRISRNDKSIMQHITEITKHLAIAQLAIELHKVRNAVEPAKHAYYTVLREFGKGEITQELDPRDEECAAIIAYSAEAYKAYQATKRKVYNAQRRLDTACRKVS